VPLERIISCFINVKDERQEKLEVMVVHEFLVRSAVPFGRVHFLQNNRWQWPGTWKIALPGTG
jgi:hypothetical protein